MRKYLLLLPLILTLFCVPVEASTGMVWKSTTTGEITVTGDSGWCRIGSDTYYVHEDGTVTERAYRWKGKKLYYFDAGGKMLKKSTRYIKVRSDGSIRYIQIPAENRRYVPYWKRYQIFQDGEWVEIGMETNVWWMCDWRK